MQSELSEGVQICWFGFTLHAVVISMLISSHEDDAK